MMGDVRSPSAFVCADVAMGLANEAATTNFEKSRRDSCGYIVVAVSVGDGPPRGAAGCVQRVELATPSPLPERHGGRSLQTPLPERHPPRRASSGRSLQNVAPLNSGTF